MLSNLFLKYFKISVFKCQFCIYYNACCNYYILHVWIDLFEADEKYWKFQKFLRDHIVSWLKTEGPVENSALTTTTLILSFVTSDLTFSTCVGQAMVALRWHN